MQYGILIPTAEEAIGIPENPGAFIVSGYGPGKAPGCAAAAELIFRHGCRSILLWGTVGATAESGLHPGDILVPSRVAYRDYDLTPVLGCTDVGQVPDYTDGWVPCDTELTDALRKALANIFPDSLRREDFPLASGDKFYIPSAAEANRVEKEAMIYDMEAAALLHFCHLLDKRLNLGLRVGIVKVISNLPQDENCEDFAATADLYCRKINTMIPEMLRALEK